MPDALLSILAANLTLLLLVGVLVVYTAILPVRGRRWMLFGVSVIAVYMLQPDLRIQWADFLLPTATLLLTAATWALTRADDQAWSRIDVIAGFALVGMILGLSALRFVPADYRWLVASRPPNPLLVGAILGAGVLLIGGWTRLPRRRVLLIFALIAIFVVLKTETLATGASAFLRDATGLDSSLANALDLNWIGFSYIAFRLIHTVRDRQMGILPQVNLQEYVTYVVFFPSFLAGPIDRVERFIKDFRALDDVPRFDATRFVDGGTRILIGIGKKFVIADMLALGMSLNATNAAQADSVFGLWILLYGYALRLFFDFSGYSDMAIGIGILFGIRLPENFDKPYTRTNITKFWQSWHITLSTWARYYVFSPSSRWLLKRKPKPSPILIVLVTQLATMIVIGLWHGVTWGFFVWGIWHGVGLWIHKQYTDNTRKFYRALKEKPSQLFALDVVSWFITFHFVVLGWVWFALPFDLAVETFGKLVGIGVS